MKKIILTLIVLLSATYLYAQKIEVSVEANSALFHYRGQSATGSSFINTGETPTGNYTNNPYGSNNGFSYGFDVKTQYVAQSGFIVGLQAGYAVLRSETAINNVQPSPQTIIFYSSYNINSPSNYVSNINASGKTYLQDGFIDVSPYIGYRLKLKKVRLDIMPGAELGFNVSSYDKGHATTVYGDKYTVDYKLTNAPTDVRIKLGLAATYNRFGITTSYAYGLTNYENGVIGDGTYIAKSNLFRFGISYQIF